MTRIHFFKKSRKVLKETSHQLLQMIEISGQEKEDFNREELLEQWNHMRHDLEYIFSTYENIRPPLKYVFCYRRILNFLVDLQELVNLKTEYLSKIENLDEEEIKLYRKKAANKMDYIKDEFKELSQEVKNQLEQ